MPLPKKRQGKGLRSPTRRYWFPPGDLKAARCLILGLMTPTAVPGDRTE